MSKINMGRIKFKAAKVAFLASKATKIAGITTIATASIIDADATYRRKMALTGAAMIAGGELASRAAWNTYAIAVARCFRDQVLDQICTGNCDICEYASDSDGDAQAAEVNDPAVESTDEIGDTPHTEVEVTDETEPDDTVPEENLPGDENSGFMSKFGFGRS